MLIRICNKSLIHECDCWHAQGGLTDLWLTDPYVVAASKLVAMAEEENANGRVFPVRHPALSPE